MIIEKILDFIYPSVCPICNSILPIGKENEICSECFSNLPIETEHRCLLCSSKISLDVNGYICDKCMKNNKNFSKAFSMFIYENNIKTFIYNFKFKYHPEYGKTMGKYLYNYSNENFPEIFNCDFIIPVPIHYNRKRQRGYNQSELIAKEICSLSGITMLNKTLIRTRNTPHQSTLNSTQRYENVKNAFKVKNPQKIKGKNILLIDDIITTGSTMNMCALELKLAGANNIYVLTLCHTKMLF